MKFMRLSYLFIFAFLLSGTVSAQNPFIRHLYTADPSARVFGDSVYVYPSHDNAGIKGKGRENWFCMEDYHVFSSANLTNWKDHGVIVSQYNVDWVDSTKFSMWAPDCIEKDGKYYFYFPSIQNDTTVRYGFTIGVAISDNPYGPFTPETVPIKNVRGIDPNVYIDKDGKAYLYWSARDIFVARLKDNMVELETDPMIIQNLPEKGLKEGPYLFERKGVYYLTFPHVENKTERLEYAMGSSPLGPFKMMGVIMDESPTGCWTNHHSILKFKDQWYLFYHQNDLSPHFDKNRSIRVDSLFFNDDGTIQLVKPSLRGVGITDAHNQIEIDRYSEISENGVGIDFIDSINTFNGWKAMFDSNDAWLKYNKVYFDNKKYKKVELKVKSEYAAFLEIRLDNMNGLLVSEIKIPAGKDWITLEGKISEKIPEGTRNLIVISRSEELVEVDWIRFKTNSK